MLAVPGRAHPCAVQGPIGFADRNSGVALVVFFGGQVMRAAVSLPFVKNAAMKAAGELLSRSAAYRAAIAAWTCTNSRKRAEVSPFFPQPPPAAAEELECLAIHAVQHQHRAAGGMLHHSSPFASDAGAGKACSKPAMPVTAATLGSVPLISAVTMGGSFGSLLTSASPYVLDGEPRRPLFPMLGTGLEDQSDEGARFFPGLRFACLRQQQVEHVDVVQSSVGYMDKTGDRVAQIQQRMQLHSRLDRAEGRPRKRREACRGDISRIDVD